MTRIALEAAPVSDDGHRRRPLQQPCGQAGDVRTPANHDHWLAPCLVAITAGAVKDRPPVMVEEPGHRRKLVGDPRGQDQAAERHPTGLLELHGEGVTVGGYRRYPVSDDAH